MSEMKYCSKCGKTMDEGNFYTYKDGQKTELCKKCLTMHIDNFNPSTFLWLLEKMDVPYIPTEWNSLRDKAYAKDPVKMNGMSVFGKYLSKMKLKQWKDYSWADTETIGKKSSVERTPEMIEQEEALKLQLEAGEISEAQYRTLVSTETLHEEENPYINMYGVGNYNNPFANEDDFMKEEELPDPTSELTQDDKIYLAVKWGTSYKPAEWIELEKNYTEMMKSFEIEDADSINTLKLLCKTNLKMNQAIDCGDVDGFQKLSRVSDALRKSAKFTAAQNKKEKGDFVDSVGELIVLCEKEGFIPRFATDIPQDKVDQTLKDMNNYLYKLVTQDLGFGQQIEDSLKKIQLQKEMNEKEDLDYDDDEMEELEDEDYEAFYEAKRLQQEQDRELIRGDMI